MKFVAYVALILLCESYKFGEKISYGNWDNEFFLRDCFLLAHPVYITSRAKNVKCDIFATVWPILMKFSLAMRMRPPKLMSDQKF